MKHRSAKAAIETAVTALCEIALLHLQDAPTVDDARRIAQAALKALGRDHVVITRREPPFGFMVTSAAGDADAEREIGEAMRDAINGILEADGVPVPEWSIRMIDDHPAGRGSE